MLRELPSHKAAAEPQGWLQAPLPVQAGRSLASPISAAIDLAQNHIGLDGSEHPDSMRDTGRQGHAGYK